MADQNNKILAYVSTLKKFEAALELFGPTYYDNSIVFIEDTQQIYTHGTYFDGGGINWLVVKEGILQKGEDRFNIWYCDYDEFSSIEKADSVLSIVNYVVTAGEFALGMAPGEIAVGTRLFKGDTLLRLIMDEMLLENDIELEDGFKISPDNFPGVIKQLFKLLKGYRPEEPTNPGENIYWGTTDGQESIYEDQYNTNWGDLESGEITEGNLYWNDLTVGGSGEVGIYWGTTDGRESIAEKDYNTNWGSTVDDKQTEGDQYWNDLTVGGSGEVGINDDIYWGTTNGQESIAEKDYNTNWDDNSDFESTWNTL